MCRFLTSFLVLILSMASVGALAQSAFFRIAGAAERLQPSTQKYLQYTETKEGLINFNSILTRSVEKTRYRDQDAFLVTQTYQTNKHINKDSSYCFLQTLLPIAYFTDIQSEQYKEKVYFSHDSIDNTIDFKDSLRRFSKATDATYNGVVTDNLISLLPLQEGKEFVFKTVNPGLHYFEYETRIVVEGKEDVLLPDGNKILCWRLRIYQGNSGNFSMQWYSVSAKRQLKTRFELKNGGAFIRVAIMC